MKSGGALPSKIVFMAALLLSAFRPTFSRAYAAECPQKPNLGERLSRFTGVYNNHAYGYRTMIPAGLTGVDNADTGYQHGFVLILADGAGTVWVSGDVNSMEYRDARSAAEFDLRTLKGVAEQVTASRYLPEQVSGQAAQRVVAEFRCKNDPELYRYESISAVRGRFVYTLTWNGSVSGTTEAEKVLKWLARTWKFVQAR